ncbi:hypothetical protein D3C83_245820 [compost metagenome]
MSIDSLPPSIFGASVMFLALGELSALSEEQDPVSTPGSFRSSARKAAFAQSVRTWMMRSLSSPSPCPKANRVCW